MERFCKKCGKPLNANGGCSCQETPSFMEKVKSFFGAILHRMGFGGKTLEETLNMFERGQKIVPDNIAPDQDEIPIKQYNIAKLRSRILGKFSEGRLMLTNKRVIFRASGTSWKGRELLQYEIDINEIGGFEIKKACRFSPMNFILAIITTFVVSSPATDFFSLLNEQVPPIASVLSISLALTSIALFFIIKKKFWLKLLCMSLAIGATTVLDKPSEKVMSLILGDSLFKTMDLLSSAVLIVWVACMILTSITPDLRLCFKSKSLGDGVSVRRKIWGFFKQPQEHTDFSEVLPWEDTDRAINELGAIIHDIQSSGNYAIDNWKED